MTSTSSLKPVASNAPPRLPSLRLIVVVLTVAGLFGMHGLSSGHAMPGLPSGASAHQPMAMADHVSQMGVASQGLAKPPVPHSEHPQLATRPATIDGGMGTGLCVAVLAGSLFLLLFRVLLHRRRETSKRSSAVALKAAQPARAPPLAYLAPSLSRLCILRT
jgi:Family of unknown function (DUF6153)